MAEKMNDSVKDFWNEFCRENDLDSAAHFQVWYFGNSRQMALELVNLVIQGKKCATASLVEVNKLFPANAPIDDVYSVVTDFDGNPVCIIQTCEIRNLPFDEVDEKFAFDEGEGDQTLEYWRKVHWDYFTKESAELNLEFSEKSIVCCERFKLLKVM